MIPAAIPRVPLGTWPTPLQPLPRLGEEVGCSLYVKRDDMTGLGGGGNKARKLEYHLGQAVAEGATHVITTGSVQSNHCHLTAAAARRLGLMPILILVSNPPGAATGNLLLDRLMDADVRFVASGSAERAMDGAARQITRDGGRPHVIPEGGSDALGSFGYMGAVDEIRLQLTADRGEVLRPLVVVANGSCGTHAGLLAGALASWPELTILGISVSGDPAVKVGKTARLASEALALAGITRAVGPEAVWIDGSYKGPDYGVLTDACRGAIRLAARSEGLFLDPVYTGKALAGLIDLGGRGRLAGFDAVVLVHSGGFASLFDPGFDLLEKEHADV